MGLAASSEALGAAYGGTDIALAGSVFARLTSAAPIRSSLDGGSTRELSERQLYAKPPFLFNAGFIIDRNIAEYHAVVHLGCMQLSFATHFLPTHALRTFFAAVRVSDS